MRPPPRRVLPASPRSGPVLVGDGRRHASQAADPHAARTKSCPEGSTTRGANTKPPIDGRKQIATFVWGTSTKGCAGDSGGPIFWNNEVVGASSGGYPCNEHPDHYGDPLVHRAALQEAAAEPCSGWSEIDGTVAYGGPLSQLRIVGDGGLSLIPRGFDGELQFLAGERVRVRHVGDQLIQVLGYRPRGGRVFYGTVVVEDARVWLDGVSNKTYFITSGPKASNAQVLAELRRHPGKRVMVKGVSQQSTGTGTSEPGVGSETASQVTAHSWRVAWGLY